MPDAKVSFAVYIHTRQTQWQGLMVSYHRHSYINRNLIMMLQRISDLFFADEWCKNGWHDDVNLCFASATVCTKLGALPRHEQGENVLCEGSFTHTHTHRDKNFMVHSGAPRKLRHLFSNGHKSCLNQERFGFPILLCWNTKDYICHYLSVLSLQHF